MFGTGIFAIILYDQRLDRGRNRVVARLMYFYQEVCDGVVGS